METVIRIVIFITKNKRYCNEISNIPIHMHKFSYRIVTSTNIVHMKSFYFQKE